MKSKGGIGLFMRGGEGEKKKTPLLSRQKTDEQKGGKPLIGKRRRT